MPNPRNSRTSRIKEFFEEAKMKREEEKVISVKMVSSGEDLHLSKKVP